MKNFIILHFRKVIIFTLLLFIGLFSLGVIRDFPVEIIASFVFAAIPVCIVMFSELGEKKEKAFRFWKINNQLYLCKECEKYSRYYQSEFKAKASGKKIDDDSMGCPHCLAANSLEIVEDSEFHPWMDSHHHCKKITFKESLDYETSMTKIVEKLGEVKSIDHLVAYNEKHKEEFKNIISDIKMTEEINYLENMIFDDLFETDNKKNK